MPISWLVLATVPPVAAPSLPSCCSIWTAPSAARSTTMNRPSLARASVSSAARLSAVAAPWVSSPPPKDSTAMVCLRPGPTGAAGWAAAGVIAAPASSSAASSRPLNPAAWMSLCTVI